MMDILIILGVFLLGVSLGIIISKAREPVWIDPELERFVEWLKKEQYAR